MTKTKKMYMEEKSYLKSKTLWFNIIMTLVSMASIFEATIPQAYLPMLVTFQGVGNMILRVWFSNSIITK